MSLSLLPENALVGLVTFGTMVRSLTAAQSFVEKVLVLTV